MAPVLRGLLDISLIRNGDSTLNFNDFAKEAEDLQKAVYVKDGHIVINVISEYNVALDRCNTAERLLNWILHLNEKTWMTPPVMNRFIRIACERNGIKPEYA